ncbi:MAG: hypothetical protein IJ568_02135 [Bacilli bacterium]|nr:hypothetical protein [Bacilli bacterium]
MKNLMKVISVFLLVAMVGVIIPIVMTNISGEIKEFSEKIAFVLAESFLPIISVAICCYCLERNDDNYFLRIIPIYMAAYIFMSIILVFAFNFNVSEGFGKILYEIMDFMNKANGCLTLISLLFVIKPNNSISIIIKKIAYGAIVLNIVLAAWISIKEHMEETLPNVYDYDGYYGSGGFNFVSVSSTKNVANKIYNVTVAGEVFLVLLLFTTNYAFSTKVEVETEDIDYDIIKQEAEELAASQMRKNVIHEAPKEEIDRSQSEKGLMNINNQLGANSNVGQVKESAKEVNIKGVGMEAIMPLSNGPVVNETLSQGEKMTEVVKQMNNQVQQPKQQAQPQLQAQPQIQEQSNVQQSMVQNNIPNQLGQQIQKQLNANNMNQPQTQKEQSQPQPQQPTQNKFL